MSTTEAIQIVRYGTTAQPPFAEAILHLQCHPLQLVEAEAAWGPVRRASVRQLFLGGFPPEKIPAHWHWDWSRKQSALKLLAHRCFGIECENQMQGLMLVTNVGHYSRLRPDQGKPLVYVDYLESAPWNVKPLTTKPRFCGIGTRLFEAAVRYSIEEGYHGRIGLHSLPQSELFYSDTCGMTLLEPDLDAHGLRYLELTREQATAFLQGE